MAGMGTFRYKAVKQLEKYQAIADTYVQLDAILEEEREKTQKEAAAELEELFSKMEADAERYRQEYEANAFYLSHDFTGDKSNAGCPFMDKDTQVWDFNRIIYGHNMGAGSDAMFSTLLKYEQEDYFKENQTIYFTDATGVLLHIR